MKTYFASPERSDESSLKEEIELVKNSLVVSGLLNALSGLLAIVNENRQVVAINKSFLDMLSIKDPDDAFGLRPGEALNCVHACEKPAGCGTTPFCSTCGAAISMVTSFKKNIPVERRCALSAKKGERYVNLALLVKSHPIEIEGNKFLLLFLQDITRQEQKAALERTFFHDISNLIGVLMNSSEMLVSEDKQSQFANIIYNTSVRLNKEVAIQRTLSQSSASYIPLRNDISVEDLFDDLKIFFSSHPSSNDKMIKYEKFPDLIINTDMSLISRILSNMVINALEATDPGGIVRIWVEHGEENAAFCVWNKLEIPEKIRNRIFQRNFSTKDQPGRGIGTYSMKLFGEEILGGKVDFTSSIEGTIFRFNHPV